MSDWQDWVFGGLTATLVVVILLCCGYSVKNERECRAKTCPDGMHARMVEGAGCACLTVPK